MTKKHFQALAEALRISRPVQTIGQDYDQRLAQWLDDRAMIGRVCRVSNPRFDRERFISWTER